MGGIWCNSSRNEKNPIGLIERFQVSLLTHFHCVAHVGFSCLTGWEHNPLKILLLEINGSEDSDKASFMVHTISKVALPRLIPSHWCIQQEGYLFWSLNSHEQKQTRTNPPVLIHQDVTVVVFGWLFFYRLFFSLPFVLYFLISYLHEHMSLKA
jgi:hypothetical protein